MQTELRQNRPDLAIELPDQRGRLWRRQHHQLGRPAVDEGRLCRYWDHFPNSAKRRGAFRDVVIVGEQNEYVTSFNPTTHDLRTQANYDALMDLLVDVRHIPLNRAWERPSASRRHRSRAFASSDSDFQARARYTP